MSQLLYTLECAGRVTAPRRSGEVVCRPPLSEAGELARANQAALSAGPARIGAWSLAEFRKWAQQEALAAAREWMQHALAVAPPTVSGTLLFVAGHQPQLTHPGVWLKNLAAGELAAAEDGVGLNLIVDPDTTASPGIDVPVGDRERPSRERVLYDAPQPQQPWEELRIKDRRTFASFAGRVAERMRRWGVEPMLEDVWPAAIAAADRTGSTAIGLTAARVEMERRFGRLNLELPVSVLCGAAPFREFAAQLCRDSQRLLEIYNAAVQAYRRRYRVRNDRHPAPDLERRGDLVELPLWFYRANERSRRRVFVRERGNGFELFAEDERLALLPADETLGAALGELGDDSRLRTRALMTTLYARLCLGDLFLHGIGGAKYDEVTDVVMRNLFGCAPPAFLTLSATLHLPLGARALDPEAVRDLRRRLRDVRFNPDRHLDDPRLESLRAAKAALIAEDRESRSGWRRLTTEERQLRAAAARRRQAQFLALREAARPLADAVRVDLEARMDEWQERQRADRILTSREYAAVLFPEALLRELRSAIPG